MEMTTDFGFGFNNVNFSDKTLQLVILPDDHKPDKNEDHREPPCDHYQFQNLKGDEGSERSFEDVETSREKEIRHTGDKLVHVNSLILAAKSPFFHKLFSNGMRESGKQHVTLHILASEELAVMDLLQFMYTGTLSGDTPSALLDVAVVAEKYGVPSCINLCGELLLSFPMTLESALLYLNFSTTHLIPADMIRPHLDTAKTFIVEHFKDINKGELQEELLKLPLTAVEEVFSSDCLQVNSEDDIYDFMMKWVQSNYSDQMEEGRKLLNTLVQRFLRFPFLSTEKWECIMTCSDIDHAIASELALGALRYFKTQPPYQQTPSIVKRRAYKKPPLKAVVVDNSSSDLHSVVYIDLTRDECENILPQGIVESHMFFVGEHQLSLCFCHRKDINNLDCFGLYFKARAKASKMNFTIACDVGSMDKSSKEFVRRRKGIFNMNKGRQSSHWWTIFGVPWSKFISADSIYFINDILLLRCDLTIKNPEIDTSTKTCNEVNFSA